MAKKNLVSGMKVDDNVSFEENCESCALWKMHKQSSDRAYSH